MIEDYGFGRMKISGLTYASDLKIINNRVIPDWRRKSGHRVVADDVQDMLAAGVEIIVLGKGKPGLMKADASLRDLLSEKGIELIEEKTSRAVKTFNRLVEEGKHAAAGFHLTC